MAEPEDKAARERRALEMFPHQRALPDALCDAMSRTAIAGAVSHLRSRAEHARTLATRYPRSAEEMTAAAEKLEGEIKEFESIPLTRINMNWVKARLTDKQKQELAAAHGVSVSDISTLRLCARQVEVDNAVAAVKRKMEAGGTTPACTVADDRVSAFDAPSTPMAERLQSCPAR